MYGTHLIASLSTYSQHLLLSRSLRRRPLSSSVTLDNQDPSGLSPTTPARPSLSHSFFTTPGQFSSGGSRSHLHLPPQAQLATRFWLGSPICCFLSSNKLDGQHSLCLSEEPHIHFALCRSSALLVIHALRKLTQLRFGRASSDGCYLAAPPFSLSSPTSKLHSKIPAFPS